MPLTRKCFGWIHLWTSCSFHEIVWKPHKTFCNRARGDSKKIRCQKRVLCTKRENRYYLKCNCYRPLGRECGIALRNLNSRTDCIMLAMLEHMHLTCCVLPQEKARSCMIVYEMYCLPNIVYSNANQSVHALQANCFCS